MEALKWGGAFLAAIAVLSLILGLGGIILVGVIVVGAVLSLVTVIFWVAGIIRGLMD